MALALVVPTKSTIGKQQKLVMLLFKIFVLSSGLLIFLRNIGLSVLPEASSIYEVLYRSAISSYFRRFYEIMSIPLTILLVIGLIYLIQFIEKNVKVFISKLIKLKRESNEVHKGWKAFVENNAITALFLVFFIVIPINSFNVFVRYPTPSAYGSFAFCYNTVQENGLRLKIGYTYSTPVNMYVKYMYKDADFTAISQSFNNNLTRLIDYLKLNKIDYLWLYFNITIRSIDQDYILITQNMDSIGKLVYNDTNYFVIEVF
jgi:hypothetical protein